MLQNTADAGFMPQQNMDLVCVDSDAEKLLHKMRQWQPQHAEKWILPEWARQEKESLC
jgi:hypothetical protein